MTELFSVLSLLHRTIAIPPMHRRAILPPWSALTGVAGWPMGSYPLGLSHPILLETSSLKGVHLRYLFIVLSATTGVSQPHTGHGAARWRLFQLWGNGPPARRTPSPAGRPSRYAAWGGDLRHPLTPSTRPPVSPDGPSTDALGFSRPKLPLWALIYNWPVAEVDALDF